MRNLSVAICVAIFTVLSVTAGLAAAAGRSIDVDVPGVLDRLKQDQPKHDEAITEVMRAAERLPCKHHDVEMLKTRFNIESVACNAVLQTTNPPKRSVSISMDGISYVGVVTVQEGAIQFVPAK